MGLYTNTPIIDLSSVQGLDITGLQVEANNQDVVNKLDELLTVFQGLEISTDNQDVVNKLDQLLTAFQSLEINQPSLTNTLPPPFTMEFFPGEIKPILEPSTSPRRVIINAITGETKMTLGTPLNIALSAISVKGDRLIDERWQGILWGYSAEGAEIAVNVEV